MDHLKAFGKEKFSEMLEEKMKWLDEDGEVLND